MQTWIETSDQKRCLMCSQQLTDGDLQRINHTPLYERIVNISTTAFAIFRPTFYRVARDFLNEILPLCTFCSLAVPAVVLSGITEGTVKLLPLGNALEIIKGLAVFDGTVAAALTLGSAVGALGAACEVADYFGVAVAFASGALAGAYSYDVFVDANDSASSVRNVYISVMGGLACIPCHIAYNIELDNL
ncbi:hypothetical protein MJO57_02430 [Endozoicomonas sp. SCSIO W0465]|nr:hypothetical protein MJO57_02430 [Endozoicomonas sp. SCSIO W0465]